METVIIVCAVVVAVIAFIAGANMAKSKAKQDASSQANIILDEARRQAEVIKEKHILEAKEKEIQIKNEAEKQASQRLQKVQASEARAKQREMQLRDQGNELNRRKNELDSLRTQLDKEGQSMQLRSAEVEKMHREAKEKLEHISGISAEEAVRAATWNPAHELGLLDEIGSIQNGKRADFVLCDAALSRKAVYLGGEKV